MEQVSEGLLRAAHELRTALRMVLGNAIILREAGYTVDISVKFGDSISKPAEALIIRTAQLTDKFEVSIRKEAIINI